MQSQVVRAHNASASLCQRSLTDMVGTVMEEVEADRQRINSMHPAYPLRGCHVFATVGKRGRHDPL